MEGKKVFITGGMGFIGSNLAARCVSLGADVTLFEKDLSRVYNISDIREHVKIITGNISSYSNIESAISGQDTVFHLAAQTVNQTSMENPFFDVLININGTLNVLEACRKNNPGAKIVFTGTCTQVGAAKKLPLEETMKDEPLDIYAANKLACESYMRIYHKVYDLNTTTIRLGTLFGERQQLTSNKFGITNYFIGRMLKGEPITVYGDGKFIRDYNYIGNVVDALVLAAKNPKAKGEVFLIGGEEMYFIDMVKQTAEVMEQRTGKKAEITYGPFPTEHKKIDTGDIEIDCSKIQNILGWTPRILFREGIERTIDYYLAGNKYKEYLQK